MPDLGTETGHPVADEPQTLPETVSQLLADSTVPPPPRPHEASVPPIGWILLLFVLAIAGWLRYTGLNWDSFTHLHPDERFLTMVAERLRTVDSPLDYFRTSTSSLSPWNAGFPSYVYGNFPMTVTRYVAEWATAACEAAGGCMLYDRNIIFTAYDGIHLVGRFLSATVDLISLFFLFLIGKRLYGWRVGLLASLLFAFAVMPIQQSHFFTADNWSAAMSTIAIYFAVRASERGQFRWYALFGVFLGLSVASRINVAPLAAVAGLAAIMWLSRRVTSWRQLRSQRGTDLLIRAAIGVMVAAFASIITFRVAMPYAFADVAIARESIRQNMELEIGFPTSLSEVPERSPEVMLRALIGFNPQWLSNLEEIQRLQQPDAVFPPATQWTNRTAILFPLNNIMFWGIDMFAAMVAIMGVAVGFSRITNQRPEWQAHLIPVVWTTAYFLFMGIRWVKSMRYFLPIYPTLLLMGAWMLIMMWDSSQRGSAKRRLTIVMGALAIGMSAAWAGSFTRIYRQPLTRVAASDWFYDNIPSGATLLYDSADGTPSELNLPLRNHLFQSNGTPLQISFPVPEDATITGLRFNYLTDEQTANEQPVLNLSLAETSETFRELWLQDVTIDVAEPRSAVTIGIQPVEVSADSVLTLRANMINDGILIADTSVIMNEHWDDPLPVRMPGRDPFGQFYTGLRDDLNGFDGSAPVTHPDSPQKRDDLIRWLTNTDVIALSSQRAVWSLPRIPVTYPLMIRYYEGLFAGDLGFELVGQFHADTSLGPVNISDVGGTMGLSDDLGIGWPPPSDMLAAEEAFSVYDHPPVWIFQKTDDFSAERVRDILYQVDLSSVVLLNPGQATNAPSGLLLSDSDVATQRSGGSFADVFNPESILNQQPMLALAAWYVAILLLGWLALPITWAVFHALPSRGYALSRILALLLIAWPGWFLISTGSLSNTPSTWWLCIAGILLVSGYLLMRESGAFATWLAHNRRYILGVEVLALALFGLALMIRMGNPDVWHVIWGGEKPMDLTYFTAVLKSSTFPPYDPWYAGGQLNYYYFGFVYVGVLTQLLGITPTIAYNIIIPMLYSFTGLGVFSITWNLVTAIRSQQAEDEQFSKRTAMWAGLLSVALAIVLGNLAQIKTIIQANTADFFYTGNWFWTASRAITVPEGEVQPITEFPFFTFLYGDLHAHMIALPLTMLALAWLVNYGVQRIYGSDHQALRWIVGALAIGVLYPTNSWDWPTYIVLSALAILLFNMRKQRTLNNQLIGHTLTQAALLFVLSYIAFLPFHQTFGAGFTEIGRWQNARTDLGSYLLVYGLFLLLSLVLVARETRAWSASLTVAAREQLEQYALPIALTIAGFILLLIALPFLDYQVGLIALPMIVVPTLLALQQSLSAERRLILGLIAAAWGLTFVVEIIVIEGTVGRMNTVFKFYMQVWMILSIVGGVAFATSLQQWRGWGLIRKVTYSNLLAFLLVLAALYPLTATGAKWGERMNTDAPRSLDGMAFLQYASYEDSGSVIELAQDYDALRWMQRNIPGSPVVAEAYAHNYYRAVGNRVSMYTGSQAIIGWSGHQAQQRAVLPRTGIPERVADVESLYNTSNELLARDILNHYSVDYIYVGTLETVYYSAEGLQKFEAMTQAGQLDMIYDSNGVKIYRVVRDVQASN